MSFTTLFILVIFLCIVIAAMLGTTWFLFSQHIKPKSSPLAILLYASTVIITCLVVVDIGYVTYLAHEQLSPLKVKFEQAANYGPDHRYAQEERGSTLDYSGRLDDIIYDRDQITSGMGLKGIFVRWWYGDYGCSFDGIYILPGRLFSLLLMWLIDNTILYCLIKHLKNKRQKPITQFA